MGATATGSRPSLLLLGLLVALNALGIDSYVVALPTMQRAFGVDPAAMQGSVSAYLVGVAAGQALWGWSSDRLGRRTPLLVSIALFALGSFGCGRAGTLDGLLACRFLQAFGSAGAGAIGYALVADHWAPDERPRVYSRLGQIVGLAAIVAPLAGSAILGVAGWRAIFAGLTLVAAITLLVAHRGAIPRPAGRTAVPRAVRAGGGAWSHLWSRPGFVPGLAAAALANGAMFAMVTASSFVLIGEFGWTDSAYAGFYATTSIAFIATSQINVAALSRASAGAILVPACGAIAIVGAALTVSSLSGWLSGSGYALASGAALGLLGFVLGNALAVAMAHVPAAVAGRASSVLGVVQFGLGAAIAWFATLARPVSLSSSATILATAAAALACAVIAARAASRSVEGESNFS